MQHFPSEAESFARLAAEGWTKVELPGFNSHVGPFWRRDTEDGSVAFALVTAERHHNSRHVMHGGALVAFTDFAIGQASRFHNNITRQATVQLDTNFIDAVHIGEVIEMTPELVRATKSIIFMRATLIVGDRVVATAQGVWKRLKAVTA